LKLEIPLPPLDEQRRIVERIEAVARRVEEAQKLRKKSIEETDNLLPAALSEVIDQREWRTESIRNVLSQPPRNGLAPQKKLDDGGFKMLRISAVSSSVTRYVDLSAYKLVEVDADVAQPFFIHDGDIFVVRYNGDINRVAKAAIYRRSDDDRYIYPDKLIRLKPNLSLVMPDYLVYALGTPLVRAQIENLCKTTAGQIGINGTNIQEIEISLPLIEEQVRIVKYLDSIQAKQVALRGMQNQVNSDLDQLMQSVLERSIQGEI
jgi:type I restriction enzyme S subunit